MATVSIAPAKPRRFLELGLTALALAVGISGYVLSSLNLTKTLPANLIPQIGVLIALAIIGEVGIHFLAPYADPVILPIAVALTGVGLAMIYRLDLSYAKNDEAQVGYKQALFVGIAIVVAAIILISLRDHRMLRRYTYTFGALSLFLLLLPMIPGLGQETFGARVWIRLGPVSIQPGELVKITLAIFFAGYLVTNRDNLAIGGSKFLGMRLPRARDLGPIMIVWLIGIAILVLQRDLGTSLLFFGLFVAMLYVATNRVSWLFIGFTLFAPAVASPSASSPTCRRASTAGCTPSNPSSTTAVPTSLRRVFSARHRAASWVPDGDADIRTRFRWPTPTSFSPPWPRSWASPAWLRS